MELFYLYFGKNTFSSMRFTFLIIIYLLSQIGYGQKIENIDGNSFYLISDNSNAKTIIFLHGGINNPYFDRPADQIALQYLIENNQGFLTQASLNGFNIIVPIKNKNLNWLENPQRAFIELKNIASHLKIDSQDIYISGFSDGGTGSFKIFYENPEYFEGLIVFNGYPQHKNFHRSIDYTRVNNKKVIFFSSNKDKIIPYEFLLTEYCSQKLSNPNSFIYLTIGDHSFANYTKDDFEKLFEILTDKNLNKLTEPVQGFIENDTLVTFYSFRKKILRKFGFGEETYQENLKQQKKYRR